MRIYEFAKKHNLPSKELLDYLKEQGVLVKSHMSVVPEDGLALLNKKYASAQKKPQPSPQVGPMEKNKESKPSASIPSPKPKDSSSSRGFRPSRGSRRSFSRGAFPKKVIVQPEPVLEVPLIIQSMSVGLFAEKTGHPVSDVIVALLKEGQVCTKNHILSVEQVEALASLYEVEAVRSSVQKKSSIPTDMPPKEKGGEQRIPVVVVMGHVDHGKTSLLDFIRKTRVTTREKGGITQHLGAYEATTSHGNLVFLDTPGHAAFSKIRQRGASVADKAVLVIAADDGIMPQTVESIKAIQALKLPLIVAINKVDKVDKTRLEIVKRQLSQYDLLPEEWGGEVVCVPISAKTGDGIDHLLEMIALQSELMELKAVRTIPAQGYILESRLEKGRGPVATLLCRQGTLRIGDFFSAGSVWGKVTSLVDSSGKKCKEVGPSTPVSVTGFDELAPVGELFRVVTEQEYRKERGQKTARASLSARLAASAGKETVPVIIKADTNSSLEAVMDGLIKLSKSGDKSFFVIHSGIGNITESDVILAETTSALVVGFYVKANKDALAYGRKNKIQVFTFDIIYKLFETLEERLKKTKDIVKEKTKIGEAIVLKVFDIKKLGVIAGCQVKEGRFSHEGTVSIKRGRREVGKGKIKSLQRDKKVVKEVHTGFECAFLVDGFDEWHVDDVVECYLEMPIS
jgi:translation initiation factor IF-2